MLPFLVVGLLSCCPSRECPPEVNARRLWTSEYQEAGDHDTALQALLRARAREPFHILVLSGGGSNGAWGAGILKGWREHPTDPRPIFHVVTGISTGALIATFAFLGEAADDAALEETYTQVSKRDIYRDRSYLSLPFANSLATLEPLKRLIAKHLPNAVVDRVAEAARSSGRKLYVATVNLDQGRLKVWDLTALAQAPGGEKYDKYRAILLAAAAIPALFPPVLIDGALHVDGGVREQLFVRKIMLPLALEEAAGSRGAAAPPVTVHVLVNGKLGVGTECVGDCLLPIALRSVSLLLDSNIMGNLFQSASLAKEYRLSWRLCRIPQDVSANPDSHAFLTEEMRALFLRGVEWGRGTNPADRWEERLPDLEDATRRKLTRPPGS